MLALLIFSFLCGCIVVIRMSSSRRGSYKSKSNFYGGSHKRNSAMREIKKDLAVLRRRTGNRRASTYVAAGEVKGVDTGLGVVSTIGTTTNTNADIVPLNLIQQGAGSWNRIGRKARLQSVRLYGNITYTSSPAATTGNIDGAICRMTLVWDKQPSGAAIPSFDDIFGTTVQDGTEASDFQDPIKYDNMARFSVLRDHYITVEPSLQSQASGTEDQWRIQKPFDLFVSLKGRETVFSGQSNPMTIADISTGALYLVFRANQGTTGIASFAVDTASFARLRYTDV